MSDLLKFLVPVSSSQTSPPARQVCSVIFFLHIFLQWCQERVCLDGPSETSRHTGSGLPRDSTASQCIHQGPQSSLGWSRSGKERFSTLEEEKVHSFHLLLHCITLIYSFHPDLSNRGCGHSLDDMRALQTPIKDTVPLMVVFPLLGFTQHSHSDVLQKPPPYATVT